MTDESRRILYVLALSAKRNPHDNELLSDTLRMAVSNELITLGQISDECGVSVSTAQQWMNGFPPSDPELRTKLYILLLDTISVRSTYS